MVLWLSFIVLSGLVVGILLWALLRSPRVAPVEADLDTSFFEDQLAAAEDEEARAEIGRRILRARRQQVTQSYTTLSRSGRLAWIVVLVLFVMGGSAGLYVLMGQPANPTVPRGLQTVEEITASASIQELVPYMASRMRQRPDDAQGWGLLASTATSIGRHDIASTALANLARLQPGDARILATWGEAIIASERGIVTPRALEILKRAIDLDGTLASPQYYLGLYAMQQGEAVTALSVWRALLSQTPPGAPWAEQLNRAISELEAGG
jgi:cytochrome c-type biogenesis protein CcmH